MIEEILPNLYRLEIPLPRNPLRQLNSYFIRGPQRSLLVDTGMNREECRTAMDASLRELGVEMSETDIFLTHMHSDHSGLVSNIATATTRVYCSQLDGDRLNSDGRWENMLGFARLNGFPQRELEQVVDNHPGHRYGVGGLSHFHALKEGDTLSVGDFLFACVETPGHTLGHLCLYERSRRLLIAGDHILGSITPNISLWDLKANPLKQYLESLDKISAFEVDVVLPGHRSVITNCRERILELKHHHGLRGDEFLSILNQGSMDAYQVASKMSWNMKYDSWE